MNPRYSKIVIGLDELIAEVRSYASSAPQKLEAMQEIYFECNPSNHSGEEQEILRAQLQACNYKWLLSSLSLEQLWALSERRRLELTDAVFQLAPDADPLQEDELMLISFAYEGFLFQARSFLDYYMKYLCLFFDDTQDIHHMSSSVFRRCIRVENGRFPDKREKVRDYFFENVLAENDDLVDVSARWGDLLKSLRDKISHAEPLRYSFKSSENLFGGVLFDWPTVQDNTYDRSAQEISNGIFEMLIALSEVLFELPWKPGPYQPKLWEEFF